MEGDAPVNALMRAGEGGHRGDASNSDQGLLRHRLAAEQELKTMGGALMTSAFFLLMSISWAAGKPPAWVTKAWETGERHYGACFYSLVNTIAYADVVGMVVVLCLYQLKEVPAERALAVVKVAMLVVLVCIGMSHSVGTTDGWRGAAVSFTFLVACTAVMFLFCIGELKKYFLKIGKVFGF